MARPTTAREGDVPPPPMRAIGPYSVLALLGRGSHGTVVLARRPGVDRLFAIKLLTGGLDPESLARLRREAEVASRLDHPGIVQVHDVGVHDQQPYLVMDHVPGPTLAQVIERDGPMPSRAAASLVAELATALDVAHRAGVVHRDLKPANVIMDGRDGRPKVTDFGLARDLNRPSELTRPGDVLGTPYYMSPEQVRGEAVDARADVYALGVILYELLAGARPFEAPTVSELGWKILQGKPAPPSARRPDVDPRVEAVCLAALSPSRDDRPASARALALALADAAGAVGRAGATARRVVAPAALVAALGALVALGLSAWVLGERRRAARLAREAADAVARADALEVGPARARAARARVATLEAEVGRLVTSARDLERDVEAARAADLTELIEDARRDGHLAQIVDAAIARMEGVPGAAALQANLLRSRGRHDEGLAVVERARAAGDPDLALVVLQLRLELGAAREDRVAAHLDELLRLAPPDGEHGLFARAFVAVTRRDVEAALELSEAALRVAPDAAYLYLFRAGLLRHAGEGATPDALARSIAAAERAIELDPVNPDGYGERYSATLMLALSAPERARELVPGILRDIRVARELRPEPDMWVDAALACVLLDQPLAALAELEVGLEQAPPAWSGLDRAHQWRGHAQAQLGREEEAVRAWRQGRLGALPASTARLHARWLGLVSPAARARALEGAPEAFRAAVEDGVLAQRRP